MAERPLENLTVGPEDGKIKIHFRDPEGVLIDPSQVDEAAKDFRERLVRVANGLKAAAALEMRTGSKHGPKG